MAHWEIWLLIGEKWSVVRRCGGSLMWLSIGKMWWLIDVHGSALGRRSGSLERCGGNLRKCGGSLRKSGELLGEVVAHKKVKNQTEN